MKQFEIVGLLVKLLLTNLSILFFLLLVTMFILWLQYVFQSLKELEHLVNEMRKQTDSKWAKVNKILF